MLISALQQFQPHNNRCLLDRRATANQARQTRFEVTLMSADAEEGGQGREQDRFLPIANISRIMKKALPANAKIAKDAKEAVQECVSEFISFITSE
jgi:hypothetical protein